MDDDGNTCAKQPQLLYLFLSLFLHDNTDQINIHLTGDEAFA